MTSLDLLHQFYGSFVKGDAQGMISCYHDDIIFSDPAFGTLKGEKAKAMWQMLINRGGKGLKIDYQILLSDEKLGKVKWQANYTYGPNKRPVENLVTANLDIIDGKIIRHEDQFDLWKWSRQALGTPGLLLGWTPFMKNKIQQTTNKALQEYMNPTS